MSLGILGANMFTYCLNTPINMADYSGQKPGDLFDTADAAAIDAARYVAELTFPTGWEYGSAIYSLQVTEFVSYTAIEIVFRADGTTTKSIETRYKTQVVTKYSYTNFHTDKDKWSVVIPPAPDGYERIGRFHTHPMGSNLGITQFSPEDLALARGEVANYEVTLMYVYGPNGQLRKFDPITGEDILIDATLPVAKDFLS